MTPEELLAQLEEFHYQRQALDLQKAELLEKLTVPADIQALQAQAQKRKAQIQDNGRAMVEQIRNDAQTALAQVVIPEHIKAALAEIDARRRFIQERADAEMETARAQVDALMGQVDAEISAKTLAVVSEIGNKRRAIDIEFSTKAQAVDTNIANLKQRVQEAVAQGGKSIKGKLLHAVYSPGKVTWNTDKLEGMMALIPEIKQARKEGQPSVAIRPIAGK